MAVLMERPPRALGWIGGKSFYGTHKTGRWIASLLPPPEATYTYVEPYAGMLGILLQRRPAKREIVSDLDADLINWWTVVRDEPEALAELLEWTPGWSSDLFAEACHNLNHPEPVRRAYYFTLACHWVRGGMIARVRDRQKTDPGYDKHIDGVLRRRPTSNHELWRVGGRDAYLEAQAERTDAIKNPDDGRRIKGIGEPEPKRGYDGLIKRTKGTADDYEQGRLDDYDTAISIELYADGRPEDADAPSRQSDRFLPGRQPDDDVQRTAQQKKADQNIRRQPRADFESFPYYKGGAKEGDADYGNPNSRQSAKFVEPKPGRPVRLSYDEMGPPRYEQIISLARRIRRLQLEVRSAEWMVEYYSVNPNLTIYLDPPYPSAEKSNLYSFPMPDIEDWIPRLMLVKGFCAISGYGD